jgi:hypothetical protein
MIKGSGSTPATSPTISVSDGPRHLSAGLGRTATPREWHRRRKRYQGQTSKALDSPWRRRSDLTSGPVPLSEENRRAVQWRRRKWRRDWIAKFAARQHDARRWISFVDLSDWCARSTTATSLNNEAETREAAYHRHTDSIRKGEFERNGGSKISTSTLS